ncbi:PorT family protein [Hymenobacter busanensis]|uniref:PorT family protein n=1 Tax=Hymenobacter busanensis TaxID=2607656 RepID=A0A7L4ZU25_9BACT|nr:outer membrane beta-barrel protein [Hymenobacter busanensis]KAA9325835.1 PorT family protein [Hymenobacter busanensis]QHJ06325.1 outer membrane beta-barrel protein [Hymenobacter busanensis]
MKPAFFCAATAALLLSGAAASARPYAPAAGNDDTILVKLPNQVSMTIVARDKKQLRELKEYKLDSLMIMLSGYISQAEAAGSKSSNGQVTMEFYPAKDKPSSQAAPEQVRVTVRGGQTKTDRVEVMMGKMGIKVESDQEIDTGKEHVSIKWNNDDDDDTKRDSLKQVRRQVKRDKLTGSDFGVDLGLNALVNRKPYLDPTSGQEQAFDLRPFGSRYISLNWNFWARAGKNSPLYFHLGPEVAFNNYMLEGNRRFVQTDQRTNIAAGGDVQYEKSKLATTNLNLPVGFTLKFRNEKHDEIMRIGAGGFVGYRIGAHTKVKYEQDGRTHKDKDRGSYNLEDFQYGVQGTLGIRGFDLFAKYNMNDLFKENRGPKAQVVSFGITFSDI